MQKLDGLTTSSQSDEINHTFIKIKFLTAALGGQFIPTKGGQGHWLFNHTGLIQDFQGVTRSKNKKEVELNLLSTLAPQAAESCNREIDFLSDQLLLRIHQVWC